MNNFIFVSLFLLSINLSHGQILKCKSPIYCQGDLLHTVQMAGIFRDSKTFVDLSLIRSIERTLKNFDKMMSRTQGHPDKTDVIEFLHQNFHTTHSDFDHWLPTDYQVNPPFLRKIKDVRVRNMAKRLLDLWPKLGRKIKPEVLQYPHRYSIIPLPNGFIVPGGRFREIYYWDSYWIIKGLLICDMKHTVRGMLENFFKIVELYGFVPNGGRIYYMDRSQPPLLIPMVALFMEATNDILWLKNNVHYLDKEMNYWLNYKTVIIDRKGYKYRLARYISSDDSPRPESYSEDIHTASRYRTEEQKRDCYLNLRTGAESGWDFSGRWFFDGQGGNRGDLTTIKPTRILPVDLNSMLCQNFRIMYEFYTKLKYRDKAQFYLNRYNEWMKGIQDLLYNEEDGVWYDYDIELKVQRKHFFISNLTPLWTETYNTSQREMHGRNAVNYLKQKGVLNFAGGIPSTLYETGEQWDMPNAWAPLQAIVIFGLDNTQEPTAQKVGRDLAEKWIDSLIIVNQDTNAMFEKYNALYRGIYGGGGEYEVQTGFGWTNGMLLELIEHYYITKKKDDDE